MDDRDFERRLDQRLRAYESRLPDVDAPDPRHLRERGGPRWPLVAGVLGLAAVAGVLVGALLLNRPSTPVGQLGGTASPATAPSATPTPSPSPSPTATPAATEATRPPPSPTAAPTPASPNLTWTRTGSFPISGGLSVVDAVGRIGDRYVAVGVEFVDPLPVFGPMPPHQARAWTSRDGRSWETVDLGPGFENARFGPLIARGDGSLISLGVRGIASDGITDTKAAAWTTTDGLSWTEIDPPLGGTVREVVQDAKGVLAVVRTTTTDMHELWLSADGGAWERVHSLEADYVDIGAGTDGFAAVGQIGGQDGRRFAIASADGREWIDGPTPPFGQYLEVASLGGDWVVVDDPGGIGPTWFSANGLDWTAHGEVPFRTLGEGEQACREYRSQLTSAHPWLVVTSELAYPCSESGFMVHGTQYLSVDGASWIPLPLAEGTPGVNRSGSSVRDALATDAGLILVGEESAAATFWFGAAP